MRKWVPLLLSILCAERAFAKPPAAPTTPSAQASALVTEQILKPLKRAESKRSPFSRSAPPPRARRVRVLDAEAQADARGMRFVRFAVDALYSGDDAREWQRGVFLGCVYVDQKQVFLQRGNAYVRVNAAHGGLDKPEPDVCRAVPAQT